MCSRRDEVPRGTELSRAVSAEHKGVSDAKGHERESRQGPGSSRDNEKVPRRLKIGIGCLEEGNSERLGGVFQGKEGLRMRAFREEREK